MVEAKGQRNNDAWIKRLKPVAGASIRIFFFPAAGAGPNSYLPWVSDLPSHIEAFGIQLPGRGERFREPVTTDLPAMSQAIGLGLQPWMDRPFAFFGHSLGTLIAFEVARWLRRSGMRLPVHFFVAGHRAPDVLEREPPVHQLPDEEFIDKLRKLGGMAPEILEHRDLMDILLPTLRADFAIHETYSYREEAPLALPITALGGVEDVDVPISELLAWARQTSLKFEDRMFEGGHFFVHTEREAVIAAIAEQMQSY